MRSSGHAMAVPRTPPLAAAQAATRVLQAFAVLLAIALPFVAPERFVNLAILIGISALLAQSINILTGYGGQISIGHAALFGSGAYCAAVLEVQLGLSPLLAIPLAIAFTVAIGALISIPAARVREFYLAMVSLGFGILAMEIVRQWASVTGGFSGLTGIPSVSLGSLALLGFDVGLTSYYFVTLTIVCAILWLIRNLARSHIGRALFATSASEIVGQALGISAAAEKRRAYTLSAGLAGLAGVIYAHLVGYLSPDAFSVNVSIAILVAPILGGMRTIWGPVLGAAFLTLLPDQLQSFGNYQVMIYGVILLFSYSLLPNGIIGLFSHPAMIDRRMIDDLRRTAASTGAERAREFLDSLRIDRVRDNGRWPRPALLQAVGISKNFDGVKALAGVDLHVAPGTIHGLIGPNGSGKTTLLNVISGILRPEAGSVRFGEHQICGMPPHQIARLGIARTFQHPMLLDLLTVRENLLIGSERLFESGLAACALRTRRAHADEAARMAMVEAVLEQTGLVEVSDARVSELPFGRQRVVEIGRALCLRPSLIMLDEPAAGLAQSDIDEVSVLLRALRQDGLTVLIVEHHMDFLLRLVDAVTVLDEGRLIYQGPAQGLAHDARVVEAYLGSAAARVGGA